MTLESSDSGRKSKCKEHQVQGTLKMTGTWPVLPICGSNGINFLHQLLSLHGKRGLKRFKGLVQKGRYDTGPKQSCTRKTGLTLELQPVGSALVHPHQNAYRCLHLHILNAWTQCSTLTEWPQGQCLVCLIKFVGWIVILAMHEHLCCTELIAISAFSSRN